jgi:NAD(P)-dependent dehydrogenase (short-subunit alcohol dehydrogenase family)
MGLEQALEHIVMTGANSGIGKEAAKILLVRGHHLIVGARSSGVPSGAEVRPLDLTSLASVRSFADAIEKPIDVLVLNAGIQRLDVDGRTEDGIEMTFGVNHVAHYLLLRLLLPKMADHGRVVLTTSGTHDPAEKTGIPAPKHCDAMLLANPTKDGQLSKSNRTAGLRAYSTSKLANLMTARVLATLPEVRQQNIYVHAFDPGLTPATGLARGHSALVRALFAWALPLVRPFSAGMNSSADAGFALAGLADGSIDNARVYMALRRGKPTWPEPSELARKEDVAAKLWAESGRVPCGGVA